ALRDLPPHVFNRADRQGWFPSRRSAPPGTPDDQIRTRLAVAANQIGALRAQRDAIVNLTLRLNAIDVGGRGSDRPAALAELAAAHARHDQTVAVLAQNDSAAAEVYRTAWADVRQVLAQHEEGGAHVHDARGQASLQGTARAEELANARRAESL